MAASYEIQWYRGDSYPKGYVIKDKTTKLPKDITGYSFRFTVDSEKNPVDESTQKFSVVGAIDADPTTGRVSFTPSRSQTNIEPGSYYYDIQMINSAGNLKTLRKDKFKVVQDITKAEA